jgi:hypothetical protein
MSPDKSEHGTYGGGILTISKGAFYHPASWQHNKAFLFIAAKHWLQTKAIMQDHPFQQMTAIGPVNPNAAQFLAGSSQPSQQQPCSGRIRKRRRGDHHRQQQAKRVHQNMTLSSVHLLPGVIASHPRQVRRFDALAIQRSGGWMLMTTCSSTNLGTKCVVEPLPRSIISPLLEIRVDTLPCRILSRQHPPLTATHDDVQCTIDDRSHVQHKWSPSWLCRGISSLILSH